VFFGEDDYSAYLALLSEYAGKAGVGVWAWRLMPNHVRLMLAPPTPEALRAALAEAHRRYSRMINFREGWRGYLWQGRFASCPMDEAHALAASPEDWRWSSARAHLTVESDGLTETGALGVAAGAWRDFLEAGLDDGMLETIRSGERTGRPLGGAAFVARLEAATRRDLARRKPGPKPAARAGPNDQRRLV
jgi:putative transposase